MISKLVMQVGTRNYTLTEEIVFRKRKKLQLLKTILIWAKLDAKSCSISKASNCPQFSDLPPALEKDQLRAVCKAWS